MVEFTKDIYPNYKIGRWTYGRPEILSWDEGAVLEIGSFCSIAPGVKIFLGGEHRSDWITTFPFNVLWQQAAHFTGHPKTKGDVIIGNDVWLAADSVVLSGVKIGDGVVVGARSVVAKDVPAYSIVCGNPAKIVRYRFDQEIIKKLLEISWWKWEDKKIAKFMPYMLNTNIEGFIAKVEESFSE